MRRKLTNQSADKHEHIFPPYIKASFAPSLIPSDHHHLFQKTIENRPLPNFPCILHLQASRKLSTWSLDSHLPQIPLDVCQSSHVSILLTANPSIDVLKVFHVIFSHIRTSRALPNSPCTSPDWRGFRSSTLSVVVSWLTINVLCSHIPLAFVV